MTLTKIFLAVCVASTVACSGSTDDPNDGTPGGGGEGGGGAGASSSSSSSGTTAGSTSGASGSPQTSKPEFEISCHGDIAKKNLSFNFNFGVTPQCKPNDFGCSDRCKPQDVSFWYAPPAYRCLATDIYSWDGAQCVVHSTGSNDGALHCKGADCEKIFKTKADCDAFAFACLAK